MRKTVLLLLVLSFPAMAVAAAADEQLKRGAQLYDTWYAISGEKPTQTYPAYPAGGKQEGATTWRCKECHGWDYLGKSGSYASGAHATGIKGVFRVRSWSHEGLVRLLGPRGRHDFKSLVGGDDVASLSLFLREGQVDTRKAVDGNGQGRGSAERGALVYAGQCVGCHGEQGMKLDLQPGDQVMQGVGALLRTNPQRALHRIQWGVPGGSMPSMRVDAGLTFEQVVDLLSFGQTLP